MIREGQNEEQFNEGVSKRMTVTSYAREKDERYDIGQKISERAYMGKRA
ncbi:hypothetical protein GCM10025794_27450 [Massilia kyonggiensis]|jgi:hypothetical protein